MYEQVPSAIEAGVAVAVVDSENVPSTLNANVLSIVVVIPLAETVFDPFHVPMMLEVPPAPLVPAPAVAFPLATPPLVATPPPMSVSAAPEPPPVEVLAVEPPPVELVVTIEPPPIDTPTEVASLLELTLDAALTPDTALAAVVPEAPPKHADRDNDANSKVV